MVHNSVNTNKWNLDSLFQGKSDSLELVSFMNNLDQDTDDLIQKLESPSDSVPIVEMIRAMEGINKRLEELKEYILCLTTQDLTNESAAKLDYRVAELSNKHASLERLFHESRIWMMQAGK